MSRVFAFLWRMREKLNFLVEFFRFRIARSEAICSFYGGWVRFFGSFFFSVIRGMIGVFFCLGRVGVGFRVFGERWVEVGGYY